MNTIQFEDAKRANIKYKGIELYVFSNSNLGFIKVTEDGYKYIVFTNGREAVERHIDKCLHIWKSGVATANGFFKDSI
jgi:hypothetical protein